MDLHKDDNGYDLIFTFMKNNYFAEEVIVKSLIIQDKGVLDKTTSTKITWKDNADPTISKKKKKKKGKKVTVEEPVESFFNIFKELDSENNEAEGSNDKEGEDDEEEPADDMQEKLADDLDLADMIKEDIIPLALEYYLGVIEQ